MDAQQTTQILTAETLAELEADSNKVGTLEWLQQWWTQTPFLSPFDKHVLRVKPNDCPIVSKFSQVETFEVELNHRRREVSLTTFFAPHPLREFHKRSVQALDEEDLIGLQKAREQLAKIDLLPVIVFVHGLGGQMSQFEPLLQEFRNCADIFSFDLPGFGNSKRPSRNSGDVYFNALSEYSKSDLDRLEETLSDLTWEDYKTESVVDLIFQILEQKFPKRKIVFISHSMGTHLTIKLVNKLETGRVESIVLMTPPKMSSVENETALSRLPLIKWSFLNICTYMPKLFDWFRLFDRKGGFYSKSVESYIYSKDANNFKRFTQYRWNLDTESAVFLKYLKGFLPACEEEFKKCINKLASEDDQKRRILFIGAKEDKITPIQSIEGYIKIMTNLGCLFKYEVIEGANHSLFLDCPNILSGIVYKFVESLELNVSCTWVLQVKATISGDKWGLKNKKKWDKVVTLTKPLINKSEPSKPWSYLLGMKTLRQSDEIHNPIQFEIDHPEIYGIVDIGSDTPAYEPKSFGRIKYVKFKTESKVIPDNITVVKFIGIIDDMMSNRDSKDQYIVVHCHYGQNRTGFLICCYLIERYGWKPSDAIEAFETSKHPGIKHVHFKNALYLRYR